MSEEYWRTDSGLSDNDIDNIYYRYVFHPDLPGATEPMHRLNGKLIINHAKIEQTGQQTLYRICEFAPKKNYRVVIDATCDQLYPVIGKKAYLKPANDLVEVISIYKDGEVLISNKDISVVSYTSLQWQRAIWEKGVTFKCNCSVETLFAKGCCCGGT